MVQGVFGTGTVTISGNTISGNSAGSGGAIAILSTHNISVVISDDTIVGNTAGKKGGAIFMPGRTWPDRCNSQ